MVTVGNQAGMEWRVLDDARPLANATNRPAADLDPALVEEYATNGVVYLPGTFTEWVEPLRAGLQRNLESPDAYAFPCDSTLGDEPGRFFDSYCNWQLIPEYLAFVLTSAAASVAATIMGSQTAQFFHEHAFSKEAGTQKSTPWHQDLPYYCVDGRQTVSVYVALDHIDQDTAVRFVPGSHKSQQLHRPRVFSDGSEYESKDPSMTPVPKIEQSEVLVKPLQPGDAILFDFRTLHGAGDAPITTRRRAFSTRWLGDDVRFVSRLGETSPPLDNLGLDPGERMREDWFPVLWPLHPKPKLSSRPAR